MAEESKAYFWVLIANIFPGNRNYGHPTEKVILHQKLPLGAKDNEGQLHRENRNFLRTKVNEAETEAFLSPCDALPPFRTKTQGICGFEECY